MTITIDVWHDIGYLTKEGIFMVIYLLVLYTTSKIEYDKSNQVFGYSERGKHKTLCSSAVKSVKLSLECCFLSHGAVVPGANEALSEPLWKCELCFGFHFFSYNISFKIL